MFSNSRNFSILEKDTNSSNAKGMALFNLRDRVTRSRFRKDSTTKATEGDRTSPVIRRVRIARKAATVPELNRKLSTIDSMALFLRRIQISPLQCKKGKTTKKWMYEIHTSVPQEHYTWRNKTSCITASDKIVVGSWQLTPLHWNNECFRLLGYE